MVEMAADANKVLLGKSACCEVGDGLVRFDTSSHEFVPCRLIRQLTSKVDHSLQRFGMTSNGFEVAGQIVASDKHSNAEHSGSVNVALEILAKPSHSAPTMLHEEAVIVCR